MDADWITSPSARRVLAHWADQRPAWLWSGDGETLVWRNGAARLFGARLKKGELRLAEPAIPIRGQVARVIRLGIAGRASLSRIQFLAGKKPVSATCTCTPLRLGPDETGLLIVAVDALAPDFARFAREVDAGTDALFGSARHYMLLDANGEILAGSDAARALLDDSDAVRALLADNAETLPEGGHASLHRDDATFSVERFRAGPHGESLLLATPQETAPPADIAEIRREEGFDALRHRATPHIAPPPAAPEPETFEASAHEPEDEGEHKLRALSSLFDRLAEADSLYAPLDGWRDADEADAEVEAEADAEAITPEPEAEPDAPDSASEPESEEAPAPAPHPQPDDIAAIIAFAEDLEELHDAVVPPEPEEPAEAPPPEPIPAPEAEADPEAIEPAPDPDPAATTLYRVVGRRFHPAAPAAAEPPADAAPKPDLERVSRYNFDELSRILTDRVSGEEEPSHRPVPTEALYAVAPPPPPGPASNPPAAPEGALINLAGETFILNRLPLGIMVFRDQQVLFANRALTEMTGHESIEKLRQDGLGAIFPADGQPRDSAEPVTHLVRSDGTLLSVTARLQSISWQGRPALMLSAGMAERRQSHEAAVRSFAELAAEAQGEGFVAADRAGIITVLTATAHAALGDPASGPIGQTLATIVAPEEAPALKAFLELPARFAETTRPYALFKAVRPGAEITLFPEGQAGIVSGYFGFVRRRPQRTAIVAERGEDHIEPSMLARVSRGVRRPLNTIIGFSDLIRSSAFGSIENERYLEYARDIRVAGHEIAALVDELDDYARLKDGRYTVRPSDVDLGALLESCVVRVRNQASIARVLVRSAISERLPNIRVDRASLAQAVLNLLASAIDQTPVGGTVILSAQFEDDGSIGVHVRDSGAAGVDLGERFVVFRDGVGRDGEVLAPVRSSVGLALTRSLLAVNTCSLSVDPSAGVGTIFSLIIPAELVVMSQQAPRP